MSRIHGRLRRVFLDEAHIVSGAAAYYPRLRDLYRLASLELRPILLTATLPAYLLRYVETDIGVRYPRVLRASTVRPNIAYHV